LGPHPAGGRLSRLPPWIRSRPVASLAVATAIWLAYDAYGLVTAPSRISPQVAAAADAGLSQDVAVALPFAPEQFHLKLFQTYGTVSGVQGRTVLVRRASPDAIHSIADLYWVERITPLGQ
jgi:hypothetical protein